MVEAIPSFSIFDFKELIYRFVFELHIKFITIEEDRNGLSCFSNLEERPSIADRPPDTKILELTSSFMHSGIESIQLAISSGNPI